MKTTAAAASLLLANRITEVSAAGLSLICHFESFRSEAYMCVAGKWTLGYGTTRYPDGQPVRKGDDCTVVQARQWLAFQLAGCCKAVDDATRDDLTQAQFDALVSFTYNLGTAALPGSKLQKAVNMRDADTERIHKLFWQWRHARVNGRLVEVDGLIRRRRAEAHLYLTGELRFFEETIKR